MRDKFLSQWRGAILCSVRQAFILAGFALLPAIGSVWLNPKVPSFYRTSETVPEVTLQQAKAFGEIVVWVDSRAIVDFEAKHIPNAIHLTEHEWNEELAHFLDAWSPERVVVVYCSSSGCKTSRTVARRLMSEVGLENVYVLKGGWEAWSEGK